MRTSSRSRFLCCAAAATAALSFVYFAALLQAATPATPVADQSASGVAQNPSGAKLSDSWKRIRMPSFTVVGSAPAEELTRAAWRIERFRQALIALVPGARLESPVPLTVMVIESPQAFQSFLWSSGRYKVGGYFSSEPDAAHIVFPVWEGSFGMSVVFHEYTHFLMQRTMGDAPIWFNEGLAELYSTFGGNDRDSRALLGGPITHHLQFVRHQTLLPLGEMLSADGAAKYFRRDRDRAAFYAQAWALVHYLVVGDGGKRAQAMLGFINDQRRGVPFQEAFSKHFGVTTDQMEKDLREYVRRLQIQTIEVRLLSEPPPISAVEPMTEAEALQAQADVQLRIGELQNAERKLKAANDLDPSSTRVGVTLGRLRLVQQRPHDAVDILSKTIEGGNSDPFAHFAYGDALSDLGRWDEAVAAYEHTIKAGLQAPGVQFRLGVAHLALQHWGPSALAFATARQLDPSPSWQATRAMESLRLGYGALAAAAASLYLTRSEWSSTAAYVALAGALGSIGAKRVDDARPFLEAIAAHAEGAKWTALLADHLKGLLTADELLKKAEGVPAQTEAHAVIGYNALGAGQLDVAKVHFAWVRDKGDPTSIVRKWAVAELGRLERGAPSPPSAPPPSTAR